MDAAQDFIREALSGAVREIVEAKVGFTAKPRPWLKITVISNNGNMIEVEEQGIEPEVRYEYWIDQDGPGRTRVETDKPLGRPQIARMPVAGIWKYFEHMPDLYALKP